MLRARALEQALRKLIDAAVQTACKIAEDGDRRWHVVDLVCATNDAEKLLAVDPPPSGASSVDAPIYRQVYIVTHYPEGGLRGVHASQAGAEAEIAELCREYPDYTRQDFSIVCDRIRPSPPSGASPQATGGYIHHSVTDWIPTPECDCVRCTSARKSAPKPTGGASPQAETSANVRALTVHICEDCLNLRGEMCNEPGCRFCRRTMAEVADYLDVLLIRPRIDGVSVLVDEGAPLPAPVSPVEPEPPEELPCYCDIPSHILDLGCPRHQAPQCEPEPPTTCRCLDCEPLADPGPKPSEDDINRLEKAAWDSKTDRVLVWYRDRAEMFRQRLRETERAWQLDRKKPTVEPEPCVWRVTGGSLGWWVKPSCREGSIPAPWGTEKAVACHLCGAPLKVER